MILCAFYDFVHLKFNLIHDNHIFPIKLKFSIKTVLINLMAKNIIIYFHMKSNYNYCISYKIWF